MTHGLKFLFAVSVVSLLGAAWCDKPQSRPTPFPTPTPIPAPTPMPTVAVCPVVNLNEVRINCKPLAEQPDKTKWDCSPKWRGQDILPEGDPNRQFCELQALGEKPSYLLVNATGSLVLSLPQPKTGEPNPFQFFLSGSGSGNLVCRLSSGYDPCRSLGVSR